MRKLAIAIAGLGLLLSSVSSSRALAIEGQAVLTSVATLGIGSGSGQVGYELNVEGGMPRGPQAFTVADDGSIYILDSVQRRIHVVVNGSVARSISVPTSNYLRDILVDIDRSLWLLDSDGRLLHVSDSGSTIETVTLPTGLPPSAVLRIQQSRTSTPQLWTRGYREYPVRALPSSVDLADAPNDKTRAASSGITDRNGSGWTAYSEGQAIVLRATSGTQRVVVSANSFLGTAQPVGFDDGGRIYMSVQDAYERAGVIAVEETVRRYTRAGLMDGIARIPIDSIAIGPSRMVEVTASGTVYAMVPEKTRLIVYRVDLGTTYQSSITSGSPPARASGQDVRVLSYGFTLRTRNLVADREKAMADFPWNWHNTYNSFSDGVPRPSRVDPITVPPTPNAPSQIIAASEGTPMLGIPYGWGGFDSVHFSDGGYSHSDWATWSAFDGADGALNKYYPNSGPLVGTVSTVCNPAYSTRCSNGVYYGSAGIDCSGFVYAAAGYTSAEGPKKSTVHLRAAQGDPYAGWEAGAPQNVQPMNYFVASNNSHVLYYEYRFGDGTGISTLESTTEEDGYYTGQRAKRFARNLMNLAPGAWQHRSWWTYNPGESYAYANTAPGNGQGCMHLAGETVWYRFSTSGQTNVTLTNINSGDPDLYIVNDVNGIPGTLIQASSFNLGTQNESVTIGAGNWFAYVHVYTAHATNCTHWTINW